MVSVDMSVFIQIANFLCLIWVLNIVLYRPIRKILLERKNKVSGLEESVENFSKSAKEKDSEYDSGIKAARSKGMAEKATLIQIAEEEEKAIIAKINEKAQEDIAKVREEIAKDTEAAKNQLLKQVDMFASEIGKKILGRAV